MLVLLDNRTLEPREIWEAPMAPVRERLAQSGSKARARGALRVSEFKALARQVWPAPAESGQEARQGKCDDDYAQGHLAD